MPRRARVESSTALYHVTSRGAGGRLVYLDDFDRTSLLGGVAASVRETGWKLYAYCLMGTHYDLILRVANLSLLATGVRLLHTRYVTRFNARHAVDGPLFGQRFASWTIRRDAHLQLAAAFVALNPVRAGLCIHAYEWPWSSYRASAGLAPRPDWLAPTSEFAVCGEESTEAVRRFRELVELHERELRARRRAENSEGQSPAGTVPRVAAIPREGAVPQSGTVPRSWPDPRSQSYS